MKRLWHYSLTFLAAIMLLSVTACTTSHKQERVGEYIDDTVVTTRVKTAILNDPTLKFMEIKVETYKGVVQLSGFVSTPTQASRAVQVARQVNGVESVINKMSIK